MRLNELANNAGVPVRDQGVRNGRLRTLKKERKKKHSSIRNSMEPAVATTTFPGAPRSAPRAHR